MRQRPLTELEHVELYGWARDVCEDVCRAPAQVHVAADGDGRTRVSIVCQDGLEIVRSLADAQFEMVLAGLWGFGALERAVEAQHPFLA